MLAEDTTKLRYRFRTIENLLGSRQELERQTIFFASAHQQNDPMEGLVDLKWQGDAILWRNFFLHYLRCLYLAYTQFLIGGHEVEIEVPIFANSDTFPRMETSADFHRARTIFRGNCELRKASRLLGQRTRPMGEHEVRYIFNRVHYLAFDAIMKGITLPRPMTDKFEQPLPQGASVPLAKLIRETDRFAARHPSPEKLEAFHRSLNSAFDEMLFITAYNRNESGEPFSNSHVLLAGGFPKLYIQSIKKLVFSQSYAACFVSGCNNSSMWSHYAKNHTGAALVFEPDADADGSLSIRLEGVTGYYGGPHGSGFTRGHVKFKFMDVDYDNPHRPIDFFSTLGQLPFAIIGKDWYADGKRRTNKQVLADDSDEWRKYYWDEIEANSLKKTRDWAYENESRLILHSLLGEKSQEERLFAYSFRNLKGIIFGMNTSDFDKLAISKILEKKCRTEDRFDLEFYQAYFDPKARDIKMESLKFLRFERANV